MAVVVEVVVGATTELPALVETEAVPEDSTIRARRVRRIGVVVAVERVKTLEQPVPSEAVAREGRGSSSCGMNYPLYLCPI